MRRFVTIVLVLLVVGGGSWFAYQQFAGPRAAAAPDYEIVPVSRGTVTANVSATGSVLPEREARLVFEGTGMITAVEIESGDQVKAGQLLAQLDTSDIELAVRQAEIGLRTAKAQLQQLDEGASESDLAAAEAALASAQAGYEQVLKGSDADQLAAARAQVEQARVALEQAQQAYDKVKDLPNVGMLPQSLQLQQATINYETAEAQFRVTSRGSNQAQVRAAQAQVAQAQAGLDKLKKGATGTQREIAQAQVDQAQVALEQAQRRLDNAQLVAPWDGVVTAVNIVEGTLAAPSTPAIQLADNSKYHIDVQVDEADIASISENQPVQIELDALPAQKLGGHVDRVAPSATASANGVIAYPVRIAIDPTELPLRSGMSATSNITSDSRTNVLLIPNRSVQIDRESGRTFVERLSDGVPQQVEVRLGLRDEQQSEVREGLSDGDQVIIRQVSGLQQLQQTFGGGF